MKFILNKRYGFLTAWIKDDKCSISLTPSAIRQSKTQSSSPFKGNEFTYFVRPNPWVINTAAKTKITVREFTFEAGILNVLYGWNQLDVESLVFPLYRAGKNK